MAAGTAWARAFLDALQPHRAGVYVNFLDSDDDTSRVCEPYGDDTYQRLAEVKTKYDPRPAPVVQPDLGNGASAGGAASPAALRKAGVAIRPRGRSARRGAGPVGRHRG
jgi:hypothetical protein